MPVRLAKRLMDLQFLPHIVVINPHIKQVYDSYRQAFDMLTAFPEIKTLEDNAKFTQMITMLVDDHTPLCWECWRGESGSALSAAACAAAPTFSSFGASLSVSDSVCAHQLVDDHTPLLGVLARGVRECALRPLVGRELDLDPFLDNMLRSRISRRVIAEHHICLQHQRPGFIGVICSQLSMRTLVEAATKQCTDVSRRTFGFCPDFEMHGDVDSTFAYVPAHIEYMLFEILKNASRAVVEHHLKKAHEEGKSISQATFPPVTITVCRGQKESTIKVSDQGGGIANELKEKVWSYGFSSLDEDTEAIQPAGPLDSHGSPMAGLGFGLPLSRLHAQYFGGDIEFFSIPGYGTDVYIRVHRLGDHQEEFEI
ncbi:hypothetical protein CLOM_g9660 [Closterium sp. NIES-68]|nr:hypothetical protein CLOM_g9660 [Closterium sp. NIES-68]GJP58504.1 hypothetical protein CLOP_g362 [Closterium sp. NIES-67]